MTKHNAANERVREKVGVRGDPPPSIRFQNDHPSAVAIARRRKASKKA